jgi:transcriptional regulator with PAS, ATPase and Fis domain
LDLSDVQKTMVPGAKEVLKTGIGLDAGVEAFQLTAISIALEESGQNQSLAARKLGISQALVNGAIKEKRLVRFRGKKKPAEQK